MVFPSRQRHGLPGGRSAHPHESGEESFCIEMNAPFVKLSNRIRSGVDRGTNHIGVAQTPACVEGVLDMSFKTVLGR